ncbi:helix-turn-helix domain-containing protein [Enterococcus plantarum]|uniref:helix-turn-helix domain-containing protein n=1 Tax=Enterococcus plantarum TaxID=1077675 RepID=UPI001A8C12A9|nr:helix-turn-helix domain-containing protein [Enterococcus plantarum]MBO0468667.1 helix-turn-helix domain-containing protein [Enterococcus plantarum]
MIPIKNGNNFIKKKEALKLDLLNYLLDNGSVNVDDLTTLYTISKRTVKNLTLELLEEIVDIDNSLDISLNGNTLRFGEKFHSKTYLYVYKTLQLNYYENSIPFQLFILLFKSKSISIYDLSEQLVVSHSYLYKLIKDLSYQLKQFDLDLQIDIQSYKVSFVGDEIEIRCFAYYIFSLVFNTLNSTFKPNTFRSSSIFINSKYTETTNHLITIVENIFMSRKKQLNSLPELKEKEASFVSLIKQACPSYALASLDNNESSCMLLWLTYVTPEIITSEERETIGELLWNSELEMIPFFKTLIEVLEEEFGCSKEEQHLLMWEYYARFIVYDFFKSWKYKNIVEIKRHKNKYINRIDTLSMAHLKDILCPLAIQQYIDELSELTYSYLNLLIPVKIHLDLFEYSSIKILIENILGKNYSKHTLVFIDNPDEADLIITNVIPLKKREADIFFFSDVNSKVNWEELGKAIQGQILKLNWSI